MYTNGEQLRPQAAFKPRTIGVHEIDTTQQMLLTETWLARNKRYANAEQLWMFSKQHTYLYWESQLANNQMLLTRTHLTFT
jgi:hypothetical protein